jgi:hypothetical protein
MNRNMPQTIKTTVSIFVATIIFLLIISAHDSSFQDEIKSVRDASHGEQHKPLGHGK